MQQICRLPDVCVCVYVYVCMRVSECVDVGEGVCRCQLIMKAAEKKSN